MKQLLKVYSQYQGTKAVPTIIIKGEWLKTITFKEGDYLEVECSEGKMVITKTTPPEPKKTFQPTVTEGVWKGRIKMLRINMEKLFHNILYVQRFQTGHPPGWEGRFYTGNLKKQARNRHYSQKIIFMSHFLFILTKISVIIKMRRGEGDLPRDLFRQRRKEDPIGSTMGL